MNQRNFIRNYHELIAIDSFEERFRYLKLNGRVGDLTFGGSRYVNQQFYHSKEWRRVRNEVIVRDNGCDLAHPDYPILDSIHVHHMNPITLKDIEDGSDMLLNPDFLICISERTHKAITYGDHNLLPKRFVERTPNDTCPWLL